MRKSYKIEPKQRENARKLGVEIYPSTRKGKKIDVYKPFVNRSGDFNYMDAKYITSIGDINYLDYHKYIKIDPQEAENRRRLYLKRHKKRKKGSAGYYANKILWN